MKKKMLLAAFHNMIQRLELILYYYEKSEKTLIEIEKMEEIVYDHLENVGFDWIADLELDPANERDLEAIKHHVFWRTR